MKSTTQNQTMDYSAAGLRDDSHRNGSSTTNSLVKLVGTPIQTHREIYTADHKQESLSNSFAKSSINRTPNSSI